MYRYDQWSTINETIIKTAQSGKDAINLISRFQEDERHKAYIEVGRGKGRLPKGLFHVWRDYRNWKRSMGPVHNELFAKEDPRQCAICGGHYLGTSKITPFDYYAFYHSGEMFSWQDPAFISGNLPVDPRQFYQPPDSPLTCKWLCKQCYLEALEKAHAQHSDYRGRWNRLRRGLREGLAREHSQRVLMDRRTERAAYPVKWSLHGDPDRRSARRRSTDIGLTWTQQIDAELRYNIDNNIPAPIPNADVTECNT